MQKPGEINIKLVGPPGPNYDGALIDRRYIADDDRIGRIDHRHPLEVDIGTE
jgi:hypothetical protein